MEEKVGNKPQSRKNNIVVQEVNDEVLIYDLSNDQAFCLNSTCAVVWQACDGNRSIEEINAFVSSKLNSPVNEDLIWLALDQLKDVNLIENKAELKTKFQGMSRREVIRKVGIASLVAIPILSSVTTPVAAQTSSVCATTQQCTNDGQCSPTTACRCQTQQEAGGGNNPRFCRAR